MVRCLGCMQEYEDGLDKCPHCGYDNKAKPKEIYHIIPGTILEGRYLVGRSVGQGGFGITYVGWDLQLKRKVAIKEYFPSDFATRAMGEQKLTIYNGEAGEQFGAGLKSFIDEAQRLAKFNGIRGVVDIYDTFISNNTGYIVMEFLSGISVKDMLKANKTIDYPTAKEIVVEILYILKEVHKDSIIHRDIAPDNIFITDSGEIKLLDFGAARYATTTHSKSLSVILKPGYAPEEQYRSHGNQGPWTDIYALAATFYKLITGVTPPESMERRTGDNLIPPSKLGVVMPKNDEIALLNALNVLPENRIQSAQEFLDALGGKKVTRKKERNLNPDTGRMYKFVIPLLSVSILLICAFFVGVKTGLIDTRYWSEKMKAEIKLPDGYAIVPNVTSMQSDNAIKLLQDRGFDAVEGENIYSDTVEENLVAAQTPGTGVEQEGAEIIIIVSKGAKMAQVGLLNGRSADEVIAELKGMGFYNIQRKPGDKNELQANVVESLNIEENKEYKLSEPIIIYVSDGSNFKIDENKTVTVPDLVGDSIESARNSLTKLKLGIGISYEYSSEYDKNKVIRQNPASGEVKEGSTVRLTVSRGKEEEKSVPNVVGDNINTAQSTLRSSGYSAKVNYVYSDTVKTNIVVSQNPAGGTKSSKGSSVTINVSKGRDPGKVDNKVEKHTEKPTQPPADDSSGSYVPTHVNFTLNPTSANISVGNSCEIRGNKQIIRTESSNTAIADTSGSKVTGRSAGHATITVTSVDNDKAYFTVNVIGTTPSNPPSPSPDNNPSPSPKPKADPVIKVSEKNVTLKHGESKKINVTIENKTDDCDYDVSISNKNVKFENNTIYAVSSGQSTITFKLYRHGNKSTVVSQATIKVTVEMTPEEIQEIIDERNRREAEKQEEEKRKAIELQDKLDREREEAEAESRRQAREDALNQGNEDIFYDEEY